MESQPVYNNINACGRCGKLEYIPTHQFIRFGDKSGSIGNSGIDYLCTTCWFEVKKWFNKPKETFKIEIDEK